MRIKYVFAWNYTEIPGLDAHIANQLNIKEGIGSIKKVGRKFCPEVEVQIKPEIQKLLDVGFTKPIQCVTWLANIGPVKEKVDKSVAASTLVSSLKYI